MSPLVGPLRDILPLLVGSAVAIAFVNLVVRQSEPEKIPHIAKRVNEWGATIASFLTVLSAFLAILYVGSQTISLVSASYLLLIIALTLLIIAFLVPAILNVIPPLWIRTFYIQFEEAQSKDAEDASKAVEE